MLKCVLIFNLFLSLNATAALIPHKGEYKGLDTSGKDCSFRLGETWFEDEIEHPLSKRIEVTKIFFSDFSPKLNHFQAKHPVQVEPPEGNITIDQDIFQDIIPTSYGAVAISLSKEGIVYLEDHFNDKQANVQRACLILLFEK